MAVLNTENNVTASTNNLLLLPISFLKVCDNGLTKDAVRLVPNTELVDIDVKTYNIYFDFLSIFYF